MRKPLSFSPFKRAITEQLRNDAESETSIAEEHRLIAALCDRLESVADSLPEVPDDQQLGEIVAMLRYGIPAHCAAEEEEMAALLHDTAHADGAIRDALELIRREHAENEANILELAEILEDLKDRANAPDPNALGFMLRHVFVLVRRHLAWEGFVIDHVLAES